jgi:drug/metabolite transporter (DMT)-like permease
MQLGKFSISRRSLLIALPYLAVLMAHIIWGANFVVAKLALNEFPVMTLAFLRFGLAVILIFPFLFKLNVERAKINVADIPKLVFAGLFITTINISLFYEGLQRTDAINAAVLHLTIPMLSLFVGWWFLKEKVYWINIVGIMLGLIGALGIIGIPVILTGSFATSNMVGNIIILLSCITFVIGAIVMKDLLKKYDPLVLNVIIFAIGALTFVFPAYLDYVNNPEWVSNVSILGFLSLIYITLLSTITAFFLLSWGLKRMSITHAHIFQYIEPAVAATLAVQLLGERISYSFIVGTCLVVLGVYWGTLGKPEHHHLTHRNHRN